VQAISHNPALEQYGVAFAHSAELAHCGEMQAPSESQTFPVSQPVTPSSPKLEHWVGVLQHTAGLCFVQPTAAKPTIKIAIRMFMV